MYTKELDSYRPKASDSEKTKELGPKKIIKILFLPTYQLVITPAKDFFYKAVKSPFLSIHRLATLDYFKSEDKEPDPSIRDWLRILFLRKRAWEYRGYGLIGLVTLSIAVVVYWRMAIEVITDAFMLHPLLGIICIGGASIPLCGLMPLTPIFIWPKIILRLLFGDVNPGDVARSIDNGTWKKNYNSKYESVLAFLLFDPVGRLAQDFPYKDSHLSYLGEYLDPVSHDTLVNRWITSKSDPRIQWRLLGGDIRGRVQHRYVSEEVARVMNTSNKQEEEK